MGEELSLVPIRKLDSSRNDAKKDESESAFVHTAG
jgi:hypothetical protein